MPKLLFAVVLTMVTSYADAEADRTGILDLPSDHVIVFGEMHGVEQVPAFVAEQVESLLTAGHSVRMGLELSSDDTDALNSAMMLQDDEALHVALMKLPQWRENNDARNGVAMAAMLNRFGRLTSEHPGQLEVFAFDIPPDRFTNANTRDAHMASVIGRQRALADDGEYVLVLVGNAHAFAAPGAPWDKDFRSMVVQLMADHPVISLRNAQSGGQAWLCMPECKISPLTGMGERENGIYMEPHEAEWADRPVYHGTFFYGHATASVPLPVWLQRNAEPASEVP